jgi:hypothetical protein
VRDQGAIARVGAGGVVLTGVPYDTFYASHGVDVGNPANYESINDLFDN